MTTLRNFQIAALLGLVLASGIAAAEPTAAARAKSATSDEGQIPQVIIIGKRLSAEEKARMAQEDSNPKDKKMLSKKSPQKSGKSTRNEG